MKPRLLDAFCGAGGASRGYQQAGFHVTGVDLAPQPRYIGDAFHQADALEFIAEHGREFDVIHASPPCPAYSVITPDRSKHVDLYEPTRSLLQDIGVPWVIENVIGAPYRSGFVLCGSMFGLRVRRHRNFEASFAVLAPQCDHKAQGTPLGVYGDGGPGKSTRPSGGGGTKADRRQFAELMEMPWAKPAEIVQAIPPCYTRWIAETALMPLFQPVTTNQGASE